MNHTHKLLKYVIVLLMALVIIPGIAMGNKHQKSGDSLQKALFEAEAQAQKEICKIKGNDCQKVVELFYKMVEVLGENVTYQRESDQSIVVLNPYKEKLHKMHISIQDIRHRGPEGMIVYLSSGENLYFDNTENALVTLKNGRKFTLEIPESLQQAAAEAKICKIKGNDCQKVVDLLYEIFMGEDDDKYDLVDEGDWDYKVVIHEPYATQLKNMDISVLGYDHWRGDIGGSTILQLSDGTKVFFDRRFLKALRQERFDDPKVKLPSGREFYIKLSVEE